MNWKDCRKRLRDAGIVLDPKDEKAVEELIKKGVDQMAAVRTVYLQRAKNVIDITARAQQEGAPVTPYSDAYDAVISRRSTVLARTMQNYMDERNALGLELASLQSENREILDVSDLLKGAGYLIQPVLGAGRRQVPRPGDRIRTEDGFTFRVMEDGEVTDGDASWPSVISFSEAMQNDPQGPIDWHILREDQDEVSPGERVNLGDDEQMLALFEVILFQDRARRKSGQGGMLEQFGLEGRTPEKVLENFRAKQKALVGNLRRMTQIQAKLRNMEERVRAFTDREWRNPDFATLNADGTYTIVPPDSDGVSEMVVDYIFRAYRGQHGKPDQELIQTRHPTIVFTPEKGTANVYAMSPNDMKDDPVPVAPRILIADLKMENPIKTMGDDPFFDFKQLVEWVGEEAALKLAEDPNFEDAVMGTDAFDEYRRNQPLWMEVDGVTIYPREEFDDLSLRQILEQNPDDWEQLYGLAYVALKNKDFVEALKSAGYDSAIIGGSGENSGEVEYHVFDKSQILPPGVREDILNYQVTYVSQYPWTIKSSGEGDLYISRHGKNAGTPHKERQGPNDFAISFNRDVLLPDYMYYLLQYLQPRIAARARGTAQQAIRKGDIHDVILEHFQSQAKEEPPRTPVRQTGQGDLFSSQEITPDPATRQADAEANYKALVGLVEEGTIKSGLTRVTNGEEAAHVLADIRRNAQEGFWALVLDKDDNVLGILQHSKGTIDGTSVYPSVMAGHIYQVAGAAKVWFAHNHPSGVLSPSQADERITKRISTLMEGGEVEVQGHVLLGAGRDRYVFMDKNGQTLLPNHRGDLSAPIKPAARKHDIPVYNRRVRSTQKGEAITSPQDSQRFVDDLGMEEGIIFLDNRHQVVGVVNMTAEEMKHLRGTGNGTKILRAQSELNAGAMISVTKLIDPEASSNLAAFSQAGDIRHLDHLYRGTMYGEWESMASLGQLRAAQTFNQDLVGITSGLLEAAKAMPQKKGPAEQMISVLKKQPGVKKEEMDWIQLEDWIRAKGYVTQDEIIDFVDKNGIVVEEILLGEMPTELPTRIQFNPVDPNSLDADWLADKWNIELEDIISGDVEFYDARDDNHDMYFSVMYDRQWGNVTVLDDDTEQEIPMFDPINGQDMDSAHNAIRSYVLSKTEYEGPFRGPAQHTMYTLNGGFNHREVVFRLPHPYRGKPDPEVVTGQISVPEGMEDTLDAIISDMYNPSYGLTGALESMDWGRVGNQVIEFTDVPVDYWDKIGAIVDLHLTSGAQMDEFGRKGSERLPAYTQHHAYTQWDNVLMWMRMSEHWTADGRRALVIEEVQSDWHQTGRQYGYAEPGHSEYDRLQAIVESAEDIESKAWREINQTMTELHRRVFPGSGELEGDDLADFEKTAQNMLRDVVINHEDWIEVLRRRGGPTATVDLTAEDIADINDWRIMKHNLERKKRDLLDWQYTSSLSPPDAPFKGNTWAELAMKRALRFAAEEGYDVLTWTTGDQQNDRYDLAEYVERIKYNPHTQRLEAIPLVGNGIDEYVTPEELERYVGRTIADDLLAQAEDTQNQWQVASARSVDVTNWDVRNHLEWVDEHMELYRDDPASGFVIIDPNGEIVRDPYDPLSILFAEDTDEAELMKWRYLADFDSLPTVEGDNMRVGGEGMRTFYDKVLVNVTNRAVKKLDKKAKVKPFGVNIQTTDDAMDGNYTVRSLPVGDYDETGVDRGYEDQVYAVVELDEQGNTVRTLSSWWNSEDAAYEHLLKIRQGEAVHGVEITTELSARAMLGQTLFQDRRRGSISFDENKKATIRLTRARDMSTFLHESGHLYLELMGDLAEMAGASDQTKADYDKILKFLGVEHRSQIKRIHHEKFARSFEAYLREGKSPDPGLRDIFLAFKSWLMRIYRQLRQLDVELTPEIRDVFNRLIATDAAIKQAEQVQNFVELFTSAEEMGLSPEAFEVYRRHAAQAHEDALEREHRRVLDAMVKEEKAWWQDERKRVEEEVREAAYSMRVYRALSMLQRGQNPDGSTPEVSTFKLDKKSLLKHLQGSMETVKRLPGRGKYLVYTIRGGVSLEVAAREFGYESPQVMLTEMMRAKPMEEFIQAETDARMAEMFPDPLVSGEIHEKALDAVNNNRRAQVLAAEMRALRKKMLEDRAILTAERKADRRRQREAKATLPKRGEIALIKEAAKALIAGMKIRNVRPHIYLAAERKAGKKAFQALERKDYEKAYEYKRQQLVALETYRAAQRAKQATEKARDYLAKFERKPLRQKMGKAGVLDRIDAVLENINLRKISLAEVDRRKAQAELILAIEEGKIVAPPELLARLRDEGINWQELTVQELMGMRDIIRQLHKMGLSEFEMIVNGEKQNIQDTADELAETLRTNDTVIDVGVAQSRKGEKVKRAGSAAINAVLRPGAIARILDASGFGAFTQKIIIPIRRAYAERMLPKFQKASEDVVKIYTKHYDDRELRQMNSVEERIEPLGESLTKGEMLSIALNWGSESNRKALLGGKKLNGDQAYPEQAIRVILGKLDARDWQFVQEMWDYLDSYWPDVEATEKRRRGIAPEKVQAMPFKIRTVDGQEVELRGGYYPLVYDARHSKRQKIQEFEDVQQKMGNGVYVSSNTRAGATYNRVQNHGKVVRLGLNTIDLHLREIIRDISIGDEVNFVKRVLENSELHAAFEQTGNQEALKQLKMWLDDSAVGELPAAGFWENSLAYTRTGFTKAKIGWNLVTMFLQTTGVFQTMAEMGSVNYGRGVAKVMQNPRQAWKFIMENSAFMRERYEAGAWNKDVADARDHLQHHMDWLLGEGPTKARRVSNRMARTLFAPIMAMQSQVDATTWMAGYIKARNDGMSERDAILFADARTEAAQTSGFFADRSGLERGTVNYKTVQSQFIRIWTTLISYMLAKFGIAHEKGVQLRRDIRSEGFRFGTAVKFAMDMVLLFTLEGIASAWIYGKLPDEDDDEPLAWWIAKVSMESAISGLPFVRETMSARYGGGNTVVGALTRDVYTVYTQAAQGEIDAALIKSINNVGGTLLHYPSSQMNRLIDTAWAEAEGEDVDWYEYGLGPRGNE
jgi:hypothetical protein